MTPVERTLGNPGGTVTQAEGIGDPGGTVAPVERTLGDPGGALTQVEGIGNPGGAIALTGGNIIHAAITFSCFQVFPRSCFSCAHAVIFSHYYTCIFAAIFLKAVGNSI